MLEFKNVDVSIGKTPILRDISVNFEAGKITSIIGPNGCGKTTLLQTLNGLSSVNSGQIILNGEDYLMLPVRERAKRLSLMSQFREVTPSISVMGLIEHGRFPYMGFSRKMSSEDKEAVRKAIEYTGLSDYQNEMVNELSGGLIQRVYLAMQLAQSSEYMVMDEPANYLDFPGQREMYNMISKLKGDGKTLILVLHDLNRALQISDNLVIMKDRKIVGSGTPEECLLNGTIKDVFECDINEINIDGTPQFIFT